MTDNTLPTEQGSSTDCSSADSEADFGSATTPASLDVEVAHESSTELKKGSQPRTRWVALGLFGDFGAELVAEIFLIRLPFYLVQPGSVRPAEKRIDI